ncbi:response regulator [Sphingobacterium sp.]|uniref:response regulator n=1 Tax=Sphingobacterium sp. TaxID=341027 RepID=UPI0028AB3B24|nr:response regulator [Sphingobacterium sp.]
MENKKILIFDDDRHVLEIFTIVLEDMGHIVYQSRTSHDVLEKVSSFKPDLIFMDNWIPDIGGVAATQMLKSSPLYRDIPVILVSANSDIEFLAGQAKANCFLSKPFDLVSFEAIVNRILQP